LWALIKALPGEYRVGLFFGLFFAAGIGQQKIFAHDAARLIVATIHGRHPPGRR
jgi:hypothetical protein